MEKVQFVDFLRKKEIRAYLALIGYRELNETDGEQFKKGSISRLNKLKDDDSKILVLCKPINEEERKSIFASLSKDPASKLSKMLMPLILSMAAFGGSNYLNDDVKFLMIENYCVYESLSMQSEEEQQENFKKFTKPYIDFMKIKFGKFYNEQRKKYIKRIIAQCDKENSQEEYNEEKVD